MRALVWNRRWLLATWMAALGLASDFGSAAAERDGARRMEVRGVLSVLQEDDFAAGRTRQVHHLVEEATGAIYTLRFERAPSVRLRTGQSVLVRGLAREGELAVGADAESGLEVLASVEAPAAEARRAVVLVVDFRDSAVSCSDASIEGLMFTGSSSVDGLYQASSHGLVSLPGDTDGDGRVDVFRVSISSSVTGSCDPYGWAGAAESAATGSGVNLGLYQHRIFVLPGNVNCGWAGLGNVGCGTFCRAWVATCGLPDVYAHEVGHNLDLAHASTDTNNDGIVDCEYCDQSDFMGYGGVGWRMVNGPHEQQKSWLPSSQIVEVASAGTSTHVLSPLEADPGSAPYPQLLKIRKPDSGDWYFLSYRRREGYDATLGAAYADRTNVHRYAGSGYSNTRFLVALQDGQVFDDAANGLSVRQVSHDATSATVQISTACVAAAPSVVLSPSRQAGRPGAELSYSVAVTNNDPSTCYASRFDLAASVPADWTGTLSAPSLTLGPGSQGQVTLWVRSDAGSGDGDRDVVVQVSDAAEPGHGGSGRAVYQVDGTAPEAVSDLAATIKRKTRVELSWTAPWDGGSGVSGYRVFRDGVLLASTPGTLYLDSITSSGATYEYHVTALDAAGNESLPSNLVRITVVGGTRGGAKEVCNDGADNDADGRVDCGDTDCARSRYCR